MDNITWIETVSSYITWMSKIHSVAEVVHIAQFGLEVTPDVSTIIQRIFAYYLSPGSPVTSLQYLCKNPDLKFVTPIVNFRGQSNRYVLHFKLFTGMDWPGRLTCLSCQTSKFTTEPYSLQPNLMLRMNGIVLLWSVI